MRPVQSLLVAAALLAGTPVLAFEPIGEIQFAAGGAGAGASFDQNRLVGPAVNMTRKEDGGWAGDLAGQNLNLTLKGKKLTGPNVTIAFERNDKGDLRVQGMWFGHRFRVDVNEKKAHGRFGTCSLDLKRSAPGHYSGDVGCVRGGMPSTARGSLRFLGAAASGDDLPQVALALVAVLPSQGVAVDPGGDPGGEFREPKGIR